MKRRLAIEVHFDLICPWCLIGRRHLLTAIQGLRRSHPDVDSMVEWRSHPLLPGTPAQGLPYQSFYEQRLGGKDAVAARRAQVQEAARAANIDFAFDRISVLPNTLSAHRLIGYAARRGSVTQREALIDELFAAYFMRGKDIGDRAVLSRIALECGFSGDAVGTALAAGEGNDVSLQRQVSGVPFYVFNDRLAVSGAHPPEALLEVMRRALQPSSPGTTALRTPV